MGQPQRTSFLTGVLMFWVLVFKKSHASVKSSRGFDSDTWESQVPGFEFMPQHQVSSAQAPHYPSVHSELPYLTLGPKAPHGQPKRKVQGQRQEHQPVLQPQAPNYQVESLPWSPNHKEETRPKGLGLQQRPLPLGYGYPQKAGNQVLGHLQRPHSQNRGYLKVSQPEVPSSQQRPQTQDHGFSQKPNFLVLNHQQRTRPGVFSFSPKSNHEVPSQHPRTKQSHSYFLKPQPEIPASQQRPKYPHHKPQPDKSAQQRPPGYLQKPQSEMSAQQRPPGYLQKPQPERPAQQRPPGYLQKPQLERPAQQIPPGYLQKPQPERPAQERPPGYLQKPQPERPAQERPPGYLQKPQPERPAQERPPGYLQKPQPDMSAQQRLTGYLQKPQTEILTSQQQHPGYLLKRQLAMPAQQKAHGYLQKRPPGVPAHHRRPHDYFQKFQPELAADQRSYSQKLQHEMPSNQQRLKPSDAYFQKPQPEKLSTLQRRPQMPSSHEIPEAQVLRHQKRPNFQSLVYPETHLAKDSNYQLKPLLQIHGDSLKPEAQDFGHQQTTQVQSHVNPNKPHSEVPSHHRRPQPHQQMIPSHGPRSLVSNYFRKSVPQTLSNQQEFQQGGLGYQLNSQSLPQNYQQKSGHHKSPVQDTGHQQNPQLQSFRHKLSSEAPFSDLQQNPSHLQRPTYQEQPALRGGRSKQQKSGNKQDLHLEKSSHQMRPLPQGTSFVQGSQPQMPHLPGFQPQQKHQAQEEYWEGPKTRFPNPQQGFTPQMLSYRQGSMAQQQGSQPHTLLPQGPQASNHRHGPLLWASRYAMFGSAGSNQHEE